LFEQISSYKVMTSWYDSTSWPTWMFHDWCCHYLHCYCWKRDFCCNFAVTSLAVVAKFKLLLQH